MKKRILIFLCFVSIGINQVCNAQSQANIDSLLQVIKTAKEDTNKVKVLNELGMLGFREPFATSRGINAYGVLPDVEGTFQRQLQEMDRKKREELLHQIQRLLADRVVFAPIWENGFIRAFGPRVEEPGLMLLQAFPYSAPLEDVRLKKP